MCGDSRACACLGAFADRFKVSVGRRRILISSRRFRAQGVQEPLFHAVRPSLEGSGTTMTTPFSLEAGLCSLCAFS